jgi:hypothetical protein
MRPSVGRTVHYVSFGTPGGEYASQCRAAVITDVGAWITMQDIRLGDIGENGEQIRQLTQRWDDDACALAVFNPTGMFFNGGGGPETRACRHDEADRAGGTWHWPERVE